MDIQHPPTIETNDNALEGADSILEGAKNQRMTSELRIINLVV